MKFIPKYIDDLPQILIFEADEFAIFFIFMGLGIFQHRLLFFLIIGILGVKILNISKSKNKKGFIFHILYWYGLINIKDLPNPFNRYYFE